MFFDDPEVKPTEDSSTPEEQVQENAEDTATASPEQETTEEQPETPAQGEAQPEAVDETGVPWKNRAMEWQRKLQEVASEEAIERVARKLIQETSKPQEREYTISELEQYAIQHPEYRPWVEEQKAKIIQKQVAQVTDERVRAIEQKNEAAARRQHAYQYVSTAYPECFVRDAMGNMQWNNSHPMTQYIGALMRDKRFSEDPEGLAGAADIAYARVVRSQQEQSKKKVKTLQQNLKKVQRGAMISGGGTQQDSIKGKTGYKKAMDAFYSTGTRESLKEVLKEKLGIKE